jgi:hypothetical protein
MISVPESFLHAELDYRREQFRSQFAVSAQPREVRRPRLRPAARRVAGHLPRRLTYLTTRRTDLRLGVCDD